MAEQEITYIPYGLDEISQQDLMNNLANGVSGYLDSKRWAKKDKYRLAWLAAYQDIINRGLAGASNDTGIWRINHREDPIDLDNKSTLDREMYLDAAYYIQLKMSLITPRKKEEEKRKEDLIPFNFKTDFNKYLLKGYGNDLALFADPEQGWDAQDERGADGLRATTNRRLAMLNALKNYMDSLEDGKYNFEGTTFTDLNDAKTKIQTAIDALNTPDEKDDFPAFNALGLQYRTYFSNGGNDQSGYSIDGNPVTWSLYAKHLNDTKTAEAKVKADTAKKKLALQQANRYNYATRSSIKMIGRNPQELVSKYQNDLGLLQQLNKYAQTPKLTGDEWSDIVGAFNFYNSKGALLNLSKQELERFLGLRAYNGLGPGVLKKIPGVEGFYYDTRTGLVVKPGRTDLQVSQPINGLLEKNNPNTQQQLYLNNTLWTADLTRELAGIAADVASVINPEPFSAGALALTGTGLRTWNRATDPEGFTLSDAGHTALDAGLSLFGMIPVVGDAALAARVIGKLQKAAGWLGTAFAAASVPQAAKAAWNKVVNGQDMTVDDWRAIGNVLMGATQARRIQLNRAAGNAVKNQAGGTKTEKVNEVEVKINGKTEKVEIDETAAKELQQAYKKAGNSVEETSKALRNSRAVKEKLAAKKNSDGKSTYTKEQIENIEAPQAASGSIRGRIPGVHTTRGITTSTRIVSTPGTPVGENAPLRVQYANNNQGIFGRSNFGWNIKGKSEGQESSGNWFKRQWNKFKDPYTSTEIPKSKETSTVETPKTSVETSTPKVDSKKVKEYKAEIEDFKKSYGFSDAPSSITGGYGKSGSTLEAGTITMSIGGQKIKFKVSKSEIKDLNEGKISTIRGRIAKQINQINSSNKDDVKKIAETLRKLKAKGWLKQGGSIDKPLDTMIENFFKNNKL